MSIAWTNDDTPRTSWLLVAVIGILLTLGAQSCTPVYASAPKTLAQNELQCADHECAEGFFSIGKFTISVPPNGIPADLLREHRGAIVRITIERIETPTLQRIR